MYNIENHVFGDGQASPYDQEESYIIESPEEDFYFINKMRAFWNHIDYDLLEKIVNK